MENIINLDEMLKDTPEVESNKYSRSDKINQKGFCSDYLFNSRPSCMCLNRSWTIEDVNNTVCDICKEKVLVNKGLGHYDLGENNKILHPRIFGMLIKLRKTRLVDSFKSVVDINGQETGESHEEESNIQYLSYHKINNCSLDEAFEHLYEFIESFKSKRKNTLLELLLGLKADNKHDLLFIRRLPIINLKFRKDGKGQQHPLNKLYATLLSTANTLKHSIDLQRIFDLSLYNIQERLYAIDSYFVDLNILKEKLSPTLSYSARAPILAQDIELPFDGITLGFIFFKRIFKPRILHYLRMVFNYTISDALTFYESGFKIGNIEADEIIELVRAEALVLTNRVPSLTIRSLMVFRINVVDDSYVARLPQIVYKYFAGDNDKFLLETAFIPGEVNIAKKV